MKRFIVVFAAALVLALASCSGKKAQETYETAQFEELQRNYAHARKLYQDLLSKYPDSEYAAKAKERLEALQEK